MSLNSHGWTFAAVSNVHVVLGWLVLDSGEES
jgi:hypothetical protein